MTQWPRIIQPQPSSEPAPLRGATILWTRPAESDEAMPERLAGAGATVAVAPAIEFKSLASRHLELFLMSLDHLRDWRGWLVLPSPTAIRHFHELMTQTNLTPAALAGVRLAVIGSGSAAALEGIGLGVDFQPSAPNAATLAGELPVHQTGTPVMIAGSSQSRPELREGLKARGCRVQMLALYDTLPCAGGLEAIDRLIEKHPEALVAVASPSAAEAVLDNFDAAERPRPELRWIAIGPSTRQRLLDSKVAPDQVAAAPTPDADGIAAAAAELLGRSGPPEAGEP
jgi:uroporphyrinogen-III synthase